jgi:ribosome-binding protein aMBF1 (putative translation factor)
MSKRVRTVVARSRQEAMDLFDDLEAVRSALRERLRALRQARGISQAELARRIGSSQPRVAKIEAGEAASLDLIIKCLRAVDASWHDVAKTMTSRRRS